MMKKMIVAVSLAALTTLSSVGLAGCDTEEILAKVDEEVSQLESSVDQVAVDAAENLETAKAALDAAIKDGDAANADALTQAIATLNTAIEDAKKAATDADVSQKAELEAAIVEATQAIADAAATNLEAAQATLNAAIEAGDAASATALENAIADLTAAVEVAKTAAADADTTLKAELEKAIADATKAVADTAAANLETAKTELSKVIADGDKVNADALAKAVEDINAAIATGNAVQDAVAALDNTYATDDELAQAIVELQTALEASIEAAKTIAKENLDRAVSDLNSAIAEKADTTTLNAKVAELNAAIEAAKQTAAVADTNLKAELTAAIAAATEAVAANAEAALDAAVSELNAAISTKADATVLDAKVAELNAAIEAAKQTAAVADTDLKEELTAAIAAATEAVAANAEVALDAAVSELNAAISTKADATVLDAKVAELKGLIDAVNTAVDGLDSSYATDASVAELKAQLESAMTTAIDTVAAEAQAALDAAVSTLNTAIGTKADADTVNAKVNELNGLISAVEATVSNLDGTYATDEALATLKAELEGAIATAESAAILIADWDAATAMVLDKLAELEADFADVYADMYSGDGYNQIKLAYRLACVKLYRAISVESIESAIEEYQTVKADTKTIADEIYDYLMAAGATVEDIEYPADGANLAAAKALIDRVVAGGDSVVVNAICYYGEGDTKINLKSLYEDYITRYNNLVGLSNGLDILESMLAFNELFMSLDDEILAEYDRIANEYNEWKNYADADGNYPNQEIHDEVFEASVVETFEAKGARLDELKDAKDKADDINARIEALWTALGLTGISKTNTDELKAIDETIVEWVAKYDLESDEEKENGNVNYNMVNHAGYTAVVDEWNRLKTEFDATAGLLVDAIVNIGDVDLFSGDEIAYAYELYFLWSKSLTSFDYLLDGEKGADDYFATLADKKTQYDNLVANALTAYEAALAGVDGVTVDNVTIYNTTVAGLMAWYDEYAAKDEAGNVIFVNVNHNGDADFEATEGYVLSDTLTVLAADYEAAVALENALNTLVEAKNAEKATIEAMIEALGTITTDSKAAIEEAKTAYDAWLNGTAAPEGFNADQFKIDEMSDVYVIDNYGVLTAARMTYAELIVAVNQIHQAISVLDAKVYHNDIVDDADRDAYAAEIANIRAAIETFVLDNDGNRENITAEEYAKLDAGELAIERYNTYVAQIAAYEAALAVIDGKAMSDEDKATTKATLQSVFDNLIATIDSTEDMDTLDEAAALAEAKYDAVNSIADMYLSEIDVINADALGKYADEAEKTWALRTLQNQYGTVCLMKVLDYAPTIAELNQVVALAPSELAAIYTGNTGL